jgi:hypothetical protein
MPLAEDRNMIQVQNKKGKQAFEGQGRNHAKINCCNGLRVTAQECPPGLGWRPSASILYLETVDSAIFNPSFSSYHEFAERPTMGSPRSFDGRDRATRAQLWAFLAGSKISSASRS